MVLYILYMSVRMHAPARVCACLRVRLRARVYVVRMCTCARVSLFVRASACEARRGEARRGEARRGEARRGESESESLFSVMLFPYNHGHGAFYITFCKGLLFCNTKYFVLFILFSMRISELFLLC